VNRALARHYIRYRQVRAEVWFRVAGVEAYQNSTPRWFCIAFEWWVMFGEFARCSGEM